MKDDPLCQPDFEQSAQDKGDSGDRVSMDNTDNLSADIGGFEAGSEFMNMPVQSLPPPQRTFPFEKLPAELRNHIFELALTAPHAIEIEADYISAGDYRLFNPRYCCDCGGQKSYCDDDSPEPCPHRLTPNLLLANKRTYNEGVGILYGGNELAFDDPGALSAFLYHRPPVARAHLKRLVVDVNWVHWRAFIDIIGLDRLERLTLESRRCEDVEGRAWEVFGTAYWYLKSLAPGKAAGIVRLTPTTLCRTDLWPGPSPLPPPDVVEREVRGRLLELLEDWSYDVRARACAGGAYPCPAWGLDPPLRGETP